MTHCRHCNPDPDPDPEQRFDGSYTCLVCERNDLTWWRASPPVANNPTDTPEACQRRRAELLQALVGFRGPKQPGKGTRRRRALIEDITFMLDTDRSIPEICGRLETTSGALERQLRRHGRPDLARLFGTVRAA